MPENRVAALRAAPRLTGHQSHLTSPRRAHVQQIGFASAAPILAIAARNLLASPSLHLAITAADEFLAAAWSDPGDPQFSGEDITVPRLPFQQLTAQAAPSIVDRQTWLDACEDLLAREKAHTREGDAIAAARRRLPMTEIPSDVTVVGVDGSIPFVDAFEGRSQLIGYFHMWHDGKRWDQQCEGCTFFTSQVQRPAYLHSRDVTLAVFCQGTYAESRPYADFVENRLPWYSARDADALVAGRWFGFFACYLRLDDLAYETYWSTGRGTEAVAWNYALLDRTVYGRQETWEDSPEGWPQDFGTHGDQFRTAGRPTIQWSLTDPRRPELDVDEAEATRRLQQTCGGCCD